MGRRREARSLIEALIEFKELEGVEKLLNKKEEKKDEKKKTFLGEHSGIKLWIILVLLYPIVGPAYVTLLKLSVSAMAVALK